MALHIMQKYPVMNDLAWKQGVYPEETCYILRIREGSVTEAPPVYIDIDIEAETDQIALAAANEQLDHPHAISLAAQAGLSQVGGLLYHVTAHHLEVPVAAVIKDWSDKPTTFIDKLKSWF